MSRDLAVRSRLDRGFHIAGGFPPQSKCNSHNINRPRHLLLVPSIAIASFGIADMSSPCANPLLLRWIKEWYDAAKESGFKGATM